MESRDPKHKRSRDSKPATIIPGGKALGASGYKKAATSSTTAIIAASVVGGRDGGSMAEKEVVKERLYYKLSR